MSRENILIAEATKILPPGTSIEVELQKYKGATTTAKLIALLEALNEKKTTGETLDGFFAGSFQAKSGINFWRILTADKMYLVIMQSFPPGITPYFGAKITLENLDKSHLNVTDRDNYTFTATSRATLSQGNILALAKNLNDVDEGPGLVQCSLYEVSRFKSKDEENERPIIDENKINLKISVVGTDRSDGDRRYASGFIPNLESLLALFSNKVERDIMIQALEHNQTEDVMNLFASIGYNKALKIPGVDLLVFGEITCNESNGKIYWNLKRIFNIMNLDSIAQVPAAPVYQPPPMQVMPVQEYTQPTWTQQGQPMPAPTGIQPVYPAPQGIVMQPQPGNPIPTPAYPQPQGPVPPASWVPQNIPPAVAQAINQVPMSTVQVAPPVALQPQGGFENAVSNQIRATIMDTLMLTPSIVVPQLVAQVQKTCECQQRDVIDHVNWLLNNGYLKSEGRCFKILKNL